MSGPKKADVTLRLDQTLRISKRFGEASWQKAMEHQESECLSTQKSRSEAESLSRDENIPDGAENAMEQGKALQIEAETLRKEAEKVQKNAQNLLENVEQRVQKIKNEIVGKSEYANFDSEFRRAGNCESDAKTAEQQYNQARDLLRQSAAKSNEACNAFQQVRVFVEQKREEDRQRQLKQTAAKNAINAAKNVADNIGIEFLSQWANDDALLQKANQILREAESELKAEHFERVHELTENAINLFRQLNDMAIGNQKRVEERDVIKNAIVKTLEELSYDKPAVGYRAKEDDSSEKNRKLGNLEIYANTASGVGNMKLKIDLDGKVDIEVDDIPEGKESECHSRIVELQKNIETIVDLNITDWGRAANITLEQPGSHPDAGKTKVKQVEIRKVRQGGS